MTASLTELPFVDYQYPTKDPVGGRIAIIGEAPGAEEARTGKPFVGVSGRLLDENLKSVGLDRATCLVGNTFRYQPPGNKLLIRLETDSVALVAARVLVVLKLP